MSDPTVADIVAVLRREMLASIRPVEFDLKVDDETGEIELSTDDWTITIDIDPGPPSAWVAIDVEPEQSHEYDKARADAFRPQELAALQRTDQALDGLLTRALHASQDPFSQYVAESLSANP